MNMKIQYIKILEHSYTSAQREVYDINTYIKKGEKHQINNLSCYLRKTEIEEQNKSEGSRRRERIKRKSRNQ